MDASIYGAVAGAVSGAIETYGQNQVARINANLQNDVRSINNQTRTVQNERNAAITSLQRWAQTVRNSRVDEQIGRTQTALTVNFNRSRDARTRANFADSIRQAEEAGRMQAAAASSGVTGSVVDILNNTRALKNGMKAVARVDAENQALGDFNQLEFETRWALEDQKDNSLIFDNTNVLDYNTTIPYQSSVISAAFAGGAKGGGGMSQIGSAVSSFFNTPQDNSIFGMLNTNRGAGD